VSTLAIVAIVVAVLIIAFLAYRAWSQKRETERRQLRREAQDHRQVAEAGVGRAREMGKKSEHHEREARRHKELADEHARKAEEHAREAAKAEGGKRPAAELEEKAR
jgi:flagellar biosynthesis/type III secretory pathway M-ring protein FliF/YscJ